MVLRRILQLTGNHVDSNDLRVEAMEVKLRRESAEKLAMKGSLFHAATIEIPASQVQSVGDAVLLGITLASLRTAPPAGAPLPSESAPLL